MSTFTQISDLEASVDRILTQLKLPAPTTENITEFQAFLQENRLAEKTTSIDPFSKAQSRYVLYDACRRLAESSGGTGAATEASQLQFLPDTSAPYLKLLSAFYTAAKGQEDKMNVTSKLFAPSVCTTFYSTTHPARCGLFKDLNAVTLFFVEFDSLVFEMMCSQFIDWELPQTLLVTNLVQRFLADLLKLGGVFQIVVFDCHEWMWAGSPSKLLIRNLILQNLELISSSNIPQLESPSYGPISFSLVKFANWWDAPFLTHVTQSRPAFFLMTDAEQIDEKPSFRAAAADQVVPGFPNEHRMTQKFFNVPANCSVTTALSNILEAGQQDSRKTQERYSEECATMFRGLVIFTLSQKVNTAFFSHFLFKDNDAVAFVVLACSSKYVPARRLNPLTSNYCMMLAADHQPFLNEYRGEAVVAGGDKTIRAAFKALPPITTCNREQVAFVALRILFQNIVAKGEEIEKKKKETWLRWIKVMVLSVRLATVLPLSARAQVSGGPQPELSDILDTLSPIVSSVIAVLRKKNIFNPDVTLFDVIDARFFVRVMHLLHRERHVPIEELISSASSLTKLRTAFSFVTEDRWGPLSSFDDAIQVHLVPAEDTSALEDGHSFPPSVHGLLSSLFEAEDAGEGAAAGRRERNVWGTCYEEDHPDLQDFVNPKARRSAVEEKFHWKRHVSIGDDPPGLEEARKTYDVNAIPDILPTEKKAIEKTVQKFVTDLGKTAKSMDIKPMIESITVVEKDPQQQQKEGAEQGGNRAATTRTPPPPPSQGGHRATARTQLTQQEKFIRQANLEKAIKGIGDMRGRLEGMCNGENDGTLVKNLREYVANLDTRTVTADIDEEVMNVLPALWYQFLKVRAREKETIFRITSLPVESRTNDLRAFVSQKETLKKFPPNTTQDDAFDHFFRYFLGRSRSQFKFHAALRVVEKYSADWSTERRKREDADHESAKELFLSIQDAYNVIFTEKIFIPAADRLLLRKGLLLLDLPASYRAMIDQTCAASENMPVEETLMNESTYVPVLNYSGPRFQLQEINQCLERPRGPVKDPRVGFYPDPWQKDLLDLVDRRGSAIVCVPTSAGKTFVSYYCIKDVLMKSNQNVVVYVAPTRPLLNQAVADIYGRFGVKRYTENTVQVYGLLGGGEYVRHPFHCQVLVTLPENLEAVLMAPAHYEWSKKIQYIIFDEIHSLENSGIGEVWERLLMLCRAPFVALSATLGRTDELAAWLRRVQAKLKSQTDRADQPFELMLIPEKGRKIQRWSDIQSCTYLPRELPEAKNVRLDVRSSADGVVDIHPMSVVTLEMLQRKFPDDLPFLPHETVQLYDRMKEKFDAHFANVAIKKKSAAAQAAAAVGVPLRYTEHPGIAAIQVRLRNLNPDEYFKSSIFVTQTMAREFEVQVKAELVTWTTGSWAKRSFKQFIPSTALSAEENQQAEETFRKREKELQEGLGPDCEKKVRDMCRELIELYRSEVETREANVAVDPNNPDHLQDTEGFIKDNIVHALKALKAQKKFPVLVFCPDETFCNDLAEAVASQLEAAEDDYKDTQEYKDRLAAIERDRIARQRAQRQRDAGETVVQESSRADSGGDNRRNEGGDDGGGGRRGGGGAARTQRVAAEVPMEDDDEIGEQDVLEEFSFRNPNMEAEDQKEVDEVLENFDDLKRFFQRGIGVHHRGIKGKARTMIERLFRMKKIPIVFATELLALGIHSPCRTVIIAGDHIGLNTGTFRQMAGRAGRRNLDMLGYCLLLGVPYKKIQSLLTGNLTLLQGHVHVDPTVELRLLQGYFDAKDKKHATYLFQSLLSEPLFIKGRYEMLPGMYSEAMLQHLRFSLEYFAKHKFVYKNKHSTMGSLATKILNVNRAVFTKNASFTFLSTLAAGCMHEILSEWDDTEVVHDQVPIKERLLGKLVNILGHFFSLDMSTRLPLELHPSALRNPDLAMESSNYRVALPPLSKYAHLWETICRFNRGVIHLYSKFAIQAAKETEITAMKMNKETGVPLPAWDRLPLRTYPFEDPAAAAATTGGGDPNKLFRNSDLNKVFGKLAVMISSEKINCYARDPFIAMAGVGDMFYTLDDLCTSLKKHLYIDQSTIPTIDFGNIRRHDGKAVLINACIPDFYNYSITQTDLGETRNKIREYTGMSVTSTFFTVTRFHEILTNLADVLIQSVASPSHYVPSAGADEKMLRFMRTRKNVEIFCCSATEVILHPTSDEDPKRNGIEYVFPDYCDYGDPETMSKSVVYKCVDCAAQNMDVFMCETCFKILEREIEIRKIEKRAGKKPREGKVSCCSIDPKTRATRKNQRHNFVPYVEDPFAQCVERIHSNLDKKSKVFKAGELQVRYRRRQRNRGERERSAVEQMNEQMRQMQGR